MSNITYIYGLESESDGIRYIGKSDYPKKRFSVHRCKSAYKNPHLNRWMNKNKDVSLLILDEVEKSNWQFWERWYIELFKSWNIDLVNISKGGDGCDGYTHSDETKIKMRRNRPNVSGKNNPMYGKVGAMKGRKHRQESIDRMKAYYGEKSHSFGKVTSEKTKAIIRKKLGQQVLLNGILYDSIRQACVDQKVDRSTYSYRIKNGYKFKNSVWVKL